jgi:hypothetical protein
MEAVRTSETLVNFYQTHGATTQKTLISGRSSQRGREGRVMQHTSWDVKYVQNFSYKTRKRRDRLVDLRSPFILVLKEAGCEGLDWIQLAQERALMKAVMNLWIPYKTGSYLISWATIRFCSWSDVLNAILYCSALFFDLFVLDGTLKYYDISRYIEPYRLLLCSMFMCVLHA